MTRLLETTNMCGMSQPWRLEWLLCCCGCRLEFHSHAQELHKLVLMTWFPAKDGIFLAIAFFKNSEQLQKINETRWTYIKKGVKVAAPDAWNHIPTIPFKSSYLRRKRWELGETISWSSKTSRMKPSLLWWKRERKETAWMDEGFPVLCNLQGGGTTWGFKQLL